MSIKSFAIVTVHPRHSHADVAELKQYLEDGNIDQTLVSIDVEVKYRPLFKDEDVCRAPFGIKENEALVIVSTCNGASDKVYEPAFTALKAKLKLKGYRVIEDVRALK